MKCKNIELLIMKYIDKNLSKAEEKALTEHITVCNKCRNEFEIYSQMDFGGISVNAPDIEDRIMCEIAKLPNHIKSENKIIALYNEFLLKLGNSKPVFYVFNVLLGFVSTVLGFGAVLMLNKDNAVNALLSVHISEFYADNLLAFADKLQIIINMIFNEISPDLIQLAAVLIVGGFMIFQSCTVKSAS